MNVRLLRVLLLLTVACLLPTAAFAKVDDVRFQEANAAYSRHNYNSAITIYEELLQEHGYSTGALYNLANSYAQAGKIGKAVLNYERALKLDPGESDIIGNLQLIRTAKGLFTRDVTFTERILHLLSMNQWTGLAGLGVVALTCILVLSIWLRFSTVALTLFCLCCLATVTAGIVSTAALREDWTGSIVTSDSRLQISPFEGAASSGNIQEGRMVYPKKEHGNYIFVEDETGRKGWIEQSVIEPVIPPRR